MAVLLIIFKNYALTKRLSKYIFETLDLSGAEVAQKKEDSDAQLLEKKELVFLFLL